MAFEVTWLLTSEDKGCSNCPVCCIKDVLSVGTKRHYPGIPSQFDILPQQLFCKAVSVGLTSEKGEDVLFLQLPRDVCGDVICRRCTQDTGESRHGAVHELNSQIPLNCVTDKAVVNIACLRIFRRLKTVDIPEGKQYLFRKQSSH